jgi:hypothetical protein
VFRACIFSAVSTDEKSPTPLRNQERGISGGASQESRLQASMEEVPVKMCIPEGPEVSAYFTGIVVLKHLRQPRCSHDDV